MPVGLSQQSVLDCQSAMVGTGWANSCPGCMDRLIKCYSHLVGGSFLAGKVAWTLSGCMKTGSADYCMWKAVEGVVLVCSAWRMGSAVDGCNFIVIEYGRYSWSCMQKLWST